MSQQEPLNDWQQARLCELLRLGAAVATACHYVGVAEAQVQAELARNEEFASQVLRAQALAEMTHLANVHKAAQDEKNWRVSVWWLKRRDEDRVRGSTDDARTLTAELVDELARAIVAEVPDVAVQRRLIERLLRAVSGEPEPAEVRVQLLLPAPEAQRS